VDAITELSPGMRAMRATAQAARAGAKDAPHTTHDWNLYA
jgi:hypothetical protein